MTNSLKVQFSRCRWTAILMLTLPWPETEYLTSDIESAYMNTHIIRRIHNSKVSDWKVNFPDGFGWPSWIYVDYENYTKLPYWQQCLNYSRTSLDYESQKLIGTNFSRFRICQTDYIDFDVKWRSRPHFSIKMETYSFVVWCYTTLNVNNKEWLR